MLGRTIAHYRILERIGAGGMGEVYRAHDARLGRDVALKVLPAHVSTDAARLARLEREARSLAGLNHPNVVTVHSVEEAAGVRFLTMELVDGRPLGDILRAGRPPMSTLLDVGTAVADGLAAAHARGLVHRDVKPDNVVVTDEGRVKLLDFGLAKSVRAEASAPDATTLDPTLTGEGSILGTVPYASPEQLRGQDVDARSDVFSLGTMLYEIASGRRPFSGDTLPDVVSAILRDTPRPLRDLDPALPESLERLVARCLEKRPADRVQGAAEIRDALRSMARDLARQTRRDESGSRTLETSTRSTAPAAPARPRRLAVLPFESLDPDPDREFFADGMHEEVITALAGVHDLEVISRTSVRQCRDRSRTLPEIARELRVDTIVEGTVRTSEDQVRISVQLIDAATDRHLWATSYQRELRDVLTLQSDVARAIAREIKTTLTPEEEARLERTQRVDPTSYTAYLKGRHHWGRRTPDAISRAAELFQEAIDADPTYAAAHAGLADCFAMKGAGFYSTMDPREAYPRARAAARRAIALDSSLAEPYATLGYVATFFEWDWEAGDAHLRRAIALNPGYATAHLWSGLRLCSLGRTPEAIAAVDRALELDPLSLIVLADKGIIYLLAREFDAAARWSRQALDVDERFPVAHWGLGGAFEGLGRHAEAEASIRRALELAPGLVVYESALARVIAGDGRTDEARRRVEALSAQAADRFIPNAPIASVYAALGDVERAIDALEKAHEQRENFLALIAVDWTLDPLRGHPRFRDLLARIRLPRTATAARDATRDD